MFFFFFFQAEDGIRDLTVTGVQTCALPICPCNADESEPGTCKDRPLMEMDPHQLIEGMVIAGRAINSHQGFIYIRGEYRYVLDIVDAAIAEAYAAGYLGKNIDRKSVV